MNRGNYRWDVFHSDASKADFESCLFEACAKSNWRLHAYVVMSNHFHLAIETPDGNLVAGMQWLQATFANRFNRRRDERGHLFQGRYTSLVVEPGHAFGQICHYIHLNPVRAGLVPAEKLGEYRHGSYWQLTRPKLRPAGLDLTTALASAGELADKRAGWVRYARYLAWLAAEDPASRDEAFERMTRGWAAGTREFKQQLLADHDVTPSARAWTAKGAGEIRELRWAALLEAGLGELGKGRADAAAARKSAPWKVALAAWMKQNSQVTNRWLCEQLHMGTPVAVSHHVGRLRRFGGPAALLLAQLGQKTLNIKT
jgi:REP element-mobilizing transposase RayT